MPGHVHAAHDLGIYLRDAAARGCRLPAHERAHDEQYDEKRKHPGDHESDAARGRPRDLPEEALGRRQRQAVEGHHSPADEADKGPLAHQVDLEPAREPAPDLAAMLGRAMSRVCTH